jgi:mono/diheme cytochrome c family protein
MAKPNPSLYSTKKTMMWFAIISLILLVSLVIMVGTDYSRDWKTWQRKYTALKRDKVKSELEAAKKKINQKQLEDLEQKKKQVDAEFKQHSKDYDAIEKEIRKIDNKITVKRSSFQNLKQFKDSYKYFYEEYTHEGNKQSRRFASRLAKIDPRLQAVQLEIESLEAQKQDKENQASVLLSNKNEAKKKIDDLLKDSNRLSRSLKSLQPSIAKEILNAPMLDFIAPSLRIQQVVLEDLYDDYHFSKVQKVDRCTTCHLGIDQKVFENAPQPFKTHPNLELFLSPSSAHPLEKVGCTVCHGGNGHSVSFIDSAHTPHDEKQKKEWEKKYHWHRLEKWEPLMFALPQIDASCTKCHRNTVFVPQATKLNEGRELVRAYGCTGCHKIQGFENTWKVGPNLANVKSKLDRDWIMKWLENPKTFRPSTKMPQIFHLSNITTDEERDKDNAAIAATAAYLIQNSDDVTLTAPPVTGRIEEGKKLVESVGCLGCHSHGDKKASKFAAELSNLGSKVKPEWLYSWLKDPKHYNPITRMPNLRLSDQEAADITSYLLSEKNSEFEGEALPQVKPEVVDSLVMFHLQKTMRHSEAEAELKKMDSQSRLVFLGKQTIQHQGCFACHNIKGFEDSKPIGTELSDHGRKNIHQLDFGLTDIEETRDSWFRQKLKNPRIFDDGKVKDYYEKLRMPNFNFTDEQVETLTTFLLSLTKEDIPLSMQRRLDTMDTQVETGRLLVAKFNCQGCHTLDGKTGAIRSLYPDIGAAPPIINGEGKKVQEKWLHNFIHSPYTIRSWLTIRMPSFGFDEEQLNQLVHYFDGLDRQEISYQGYPAPSTTPDKIAAGEMLFEKLQCVKCHKVDRESIALGASFLAPDLSLTKDRLKPDWVVEWLADPQRLMEGTMMPGFFPDGATPVPDMLGGDAKVQMEAIRDYLLRFSPPKADKAKNS